MKRLPMFESGQGERHDDCQHYRGCLSRFLASEPKATKGGGWRETRNAGARCPVDCASYLATPAETFRAAAATFGRTGGGNHVW